MDFLKPSPELTFGLEMEFYFTADKAMWVYLMLTFCAQLTICGYEKWLTDTGETDEDKQAYREMREREILLQQ